MKRVHVNKLDCGWNIISKHVLHQDKINSTEFAEGERNKLTLTLPDSAP